MDVSRRNFLKYCGISATALGLSATDLLHLEEALANPSAPTVVWLQGSSCTGCTESFLNRIATTAPVSAGDVLINSINLSYHPTLMATAGQTAVNVAKAAYNRGGYVLVVEGGVPTAFGGACCFAWTDNGVDVTFLDAVKTMASKAAKVVCVGTCASYGGVPAAGTNPAGIKGVKAAIGVNTINIAGCPPHPNWIVWGIVQILLGNAISLDSQGRPSALYNTIVHEHCLYNDEDKVSTFGQSGCLRNLGCRGPQTYANCPQQLWNNGVNWCIGAGAPCIGCTESTFPGANPFYAQTSGGNSGGSGGNSGGSGGNSDTHRRDD